MTLLDAREKRAVTVDNLYKKNHLPIITIKGNVVGSDKNPPYMTFLLSYFLGLTRNVFQSNIKSITKKASIDGNYILLEVKEDSTLIKQEMIKLESSPIGRLIDLDVYDNYTLSRSTSNLNLRKCLICSNDAFVCIKTRAHTVDEIKSQTEKIIKDFITKLLYEITDEAIKEEVLLYPKFGLVSQQDSGSHNDMDYHTFITSKNSLKAGILSYIEEGYNDSINYKRLVKIGLKTEKDMFQATKNINTHKGLIFLLGVFLPVVSHSLFYHKPNMQEIIKQLSEKIVGNYYDHLSEKETRSNSDKIYLKHHLKGIREEALNGLEKIFKDLDSTITQEAKMDDLLYFMSVLNDTTIVHKCDIHTLLEVQEKAREILDNGGYSNNKELVHSLSDSYKDRNISPGGSADMLVIKLIHKKLLNLNVI